MAKMKMPKMGGNKSKPHVRMRKMKSVPGSAFPVSPMAFPPPADPTMGAGAPQPDPSAGMDPGAAPSAGPSAGMGMGQ